MRRCFVEIGMGDSSITAAWHNHRAYLINLAYHMLGDIGAAEDVTQEAFLRLSSTASDEIEDERGWLTVVAGRLCLDYARSARARREDPQDAEALESAAARRPLADTDPADRVTLDDEVSVALLQVLQRLSPGERVAFVLHDVFQIPFETIADTVGRPVATCRQLARRGRLKIVAEKPRLTDITTSEHHLVMEKFTKACANGDIRELASVLDPSVWGIATMLGDPATPVQVNHGRDAVATNLLRFLGPGVVLVSPPVGEPVLLAFAERRLFAVVVLTMHGEHVAKIEATFDPVARLGAAADT